MRLSGAWLSLGGRGKQWGCCLRVTVALPAPSAGAGALSGEKCNLCRSHLYAGPRQDKELPSSELGNIKPLCTVDELLPAAFMDVIHY